MTLRANIVKLASEKPDLRPYLLPILKEARGGHTQSLKIKGRDFTMNVGPTDFSAYSPDTDLEADEPSYSVIESRNAIGAMMLYELLDSDPHALSKVIWANLGNWLKGHRISFDLDYSL